MGFPDLPLGERMHSLGVVLRGKPRVKRRGECGASGGIWLAFLHSLAEAIGMNAVDAPACWTYPLDGKGGQGQTIVLPITESFLALDTWPDHRGAYLFVCSCRPFSAEVIDRAARSWGMTPDAGEGGRFYSELNLK